MYSVSTIGNAVREYQLQTDDDVGTITLIHNQHEHQSHCLSACSRDWIRYHLNPFNESSEKFTID